MDSPLLLEIKELAEQVYPAAAKLNSVLYGGGWMCVVNERLGTTDVFAVREPDQHKELTSRWNGNCQNKATRLKENPRHVSARQSFDFEKKRYFGGIRIKRLGLIITFSGLSQELDEALCAWIAVRLKSVTGMTHKEWWKIRDLSSNPHMVDYGMVSPAIAA